MARKDTPIRNFAQARALLDLRQKQGRDRAKLGNNVYLEARGGSVAVKYHDTDIVTYHPNGKIELRCNGWYTTTTKQNLSVFSPFSVWQEKGEWYVNTAANFSAANRFKGPKGTLPPGIIRFKDGMILDTPKWALNL